MIITPTRSEITGVTLTLTPTEFHDLQVLCCIDQFQLQSALGHAQSRANTALLPDLPHATTQYTTTDIYGLVKRIAAWRP